jgi:hypothetical protein
MNTEYAGKLHDLHRSVHGLINFIDKAKSLVLGLIQINTYRKVPLQLNFLNEVILHCFL